MDFRKVEIRNIMRLWACYIGFNTVAGSSGLVVAFVTFTVFTVVAGNTLDAATAFTGLTLLQQVADVLNILPYDLTLILQGRISLNRIKDFLDEEELERFDPTRPQPTQNEEEDDSDSSAESLLSAMDPFIGFKRGTFGYFSKDGNNGSGSPTTPASPDTPASSDYQSFQLNSLSITFKVGGLNLVCGPTGSGKSSLCLALLGEMKRLSGQTFLNGPQKSNLYGVAYAAQTSWLLNATIKNNILMGERYDPQRYQAVLDACALVRDLQTLEAGDETEIGEKGVNVS
ncbi:hypothetical protein HDV05_002460, partial [Chytridiales sp. JEL 0842]